MNFQRINVVGGNGAGKSTFCKKLSEITGYPHIELDALSWGPDWKSKDHDEFLLLLEKSLEQETWILDGNYRDTIPIKWKKVEAIIWLDYSFTMTTFRVIKRCIERLISQEELWPGTGNRESFRRSFLSRKSVILWSTTSYHRKKKNLERLINDEKYNHLQFIRLKSSKEADQFLKQQRTNE